MSSPQTDHSKLEDQGIERLVTDHLLQNPGFFQRNPRLLAALQIPHPTGGAISLIEQQVKVLRKQLDAERNRLTHLISRAREYESLSNRLHSLILQLISVEDSEHFCALLREAMLREFHAEAVALKLFRLGAVERQGRSPLTEAFRDFVDRSHALCGPLTEDKAQTLFGTDGPPIRAAALIPIRTDQASGVLAIGSSDPERFHPDMGTDFLDRLGEIISHKLRVVPLGSFSHC